MFIFVSEKDVLRIQLEDPSLLFLSAKVDRLWGGWESCIFTNCYRLAILLAFLPPIY